MRIYFALQTTDASKFEAVWVVALIERGVGQVVNEQMLSARLSHFLLQSYKKSWSALLFLKTSLKTADFKVT